MAAVFRWLLVCGRGGVLRPWAVAWLALSRRIRRFGWLLLWHSGWRDLSLRERRRVLRRLSRWAASRWSLALASLFLGWLASRSGGGRG